VIGRYRLLLVGITFGLIFCSTVEAQSRDSANNSLAAPSRWPTAEQWQRVVLLHDYNTRVVVFGTTVLGCAAGMVGSFTLLRKRALMGDALSHATLPGLCLAYMTVTSLGGDGKALPVLLTGATLTGLFGVGAILVIRNHTRLKEDTALGAVLSVFFGIGIALLTLTQQMTRGSAAGLEGFIQGKTASMTASDASLIAISAVICIAVSFSLFKELKLLCFDDGYAQSQGLSVWWLDLVLMMMVVIVTIVGLMAVGLVLMIALLVIPAASARFWTDRLWRMMLVSGFLGALSGLLGAVASAVFSNLPSGAMIVLICSAIFLVSMFFGATRGVVIRYARRLHVNRTIGRQHLLRAIFELTEEARKRVGDQTLKELRVTIDQLKPMRSWSLPAIQAEIDRAAQYRLVVQVGDTVRLTKSGYKEAARLTRQHRLWEIYLITHADVAPAMVDREADAIEHVLEPEVIAELESLLAGEANDVPESPHDLSREDQP